MIHKVEFILVFRSDNTNNKQLSHEDESEQR